MAQRDTVLIARRPYSNYVSMAGPENCGPDQQWDPNMVVLGNKGQCTPKGSAMSPASAADPGILTKVGDFFGTLLGGAVKGILPGTQPTTVVPVSTTPEWVMPVVIGGVGLVAILLITRPRSNPSRRRRRARRR